jgi:hypothetical protein
VAVDHLSGVASCRLTVKQRGGRTMYIATGSDKAGNVALARRTV